MPQYSPYTGQNNLLEMVQRPRVPTDFRNQLAEVPALSSYEPSWRERMTNALLEQFGGYANMTPDQARRIELLTGHNRLMGLADFVPGLGQGLAGNEAKRDYDRGDMLGASLNAMGVVPMPGAMVGKSVGRAVGQGSELAMDQASRMARAKDLGYADQVFYRGEATGSSPDQYPGGAFFSRDKEYSQGFANRGGADAPREFSLNLQNSFSDAQPVNATTYARLVTGALQHKPEFAKEFVDMVAPGKTPEWFMEFARRNPDFQIADGGSLVRAAIENSGAGDSIFKAAGFDALDVGRDVRKLTGTGIRSTDAAFDPKKSTEKNIYYGLLPALGLGGYAISQDKEGGY
jgi:hypothetical protein